MKLGHISLSRRAIIGLSAGAVVAAIGGGAVLLRGPNGLIVDILKRGIGRFRMSPEDKETLLAETLSYVKSLGAKELSIRIMGAGYAAVNFPFVRHFLPDDGAFKLEQFERQVITFFLLATDYLAVAGDDPDEAERENVLVSYVGTTGACSMPWAQIT
jgi:hypothetical protein